MYVRHKKNKEENIDTEPKTQKAIFIDRVKTIDRVIDEIEFLDTDENFIQHSLKDFGEAYGRHRQKGNFVGLRFVSWSLKDHTNDTYVSTSSYKEEVGYESFGKRYYDLMFRG